VAVIGGGSAGVAAAFAAARTGAKVVLVERHDRLGGLATLGGVNSWEPGVGGAGIPLEIYRRLQRDWPGTAGVTDMGRHCRFGRPSVAGRRFDPAVFPGGEWLIAPAGRYGDTLRRHAGAGVEVSEAFMRRHWHGVSYLPEPMMATLETLLRETGRVEILTGTGMATARADAGVMREATLTNGRVLTARTWVDGAGGALAQACGCPTLTGADPYSRFHEPDAPAQATDEVNAVSLLYRIAPTAGEAIESLPSGLPSECWWASDFPFMHCVEHVNGMRVCNMLPTMEGREWTRLGETAYAECARRVRAHWHFLQSGWPEFRRFRLDWIAPVPGIREGRRVVCEKMLTQNDIRRGLSRQEDVDVIALADHPFDRHGRQGGCVDLDEPYGIPYRCLIAQGFRNLLVAGMAAGFSSLAAASCRLTRTMMQLGQAAGTATGLARAAHCDLPDVAPAALRAALREQQVQLEWPMREELKILLERD
jgi:hypothetical protein